MLFIPPGGMTATVSSSTARPATNYGATITPGASNVMGSYTQVFTALPWDAWGIFININSNAVATASRNTLLDIGFDPAGGTSYSVLIPYLLGSSASTLSTNGLGVNYYFPLHIPSGSTIAARAQVNNATAGTLRVWGKVYGQPTRPDLIRKGTFVRQFGATTATSEGQAINIGTTAEGGWTGIATTADPLWWWQIGFGNNNATMVNGLHFLDLAWGDASVPYQTIILDYPVVTTNAEIIFSPLDARGYYLVPSGGVLYGRGQCSTTPSTGPSMSAYGVGGG